MSFYDTLIKETPPEVLYHYTSPTGLMGIIQSRSVWATMVHYLNDAQEFREAMTIARSRLYHTAETADDKATKQLQLHLRDSIEKVEGIHICVFSLTAEGDQLGQWRGYCPTTGGYSIGFYANRVREIASKHKFILAPCVYDSSAQLRLIDDVITECVKSFEEEKTATDVSNEERLNKLEARFLVQFSKVAPLIKNNSFTEEREWRLVSNPILTSDSRMRFRVGNTMLVPYYDLPLLENDAGFEIADIVVGPTSHQTLAANSVWKLTSRENITCRNQRSSRVPYRQI